MARPVIKPHSLIVFDSGIGGFSILRNLLDLPCPLVYFADQKYFPYGDRDPLWLESHLTSLAKSFVSSHPLGLVLACNTGTVAAITAIRQSVSYPVIGVEPVTKPISAYHHPVVWGTPKALESARSSSLRSRYGSHIRYYAPPSLPSAIEHQDFPLIQQILAQAQIDIGQPDAIGLSCTHFPLIQSLIQQYFPDSVIVEPSLAVAAQVKQLLFPQGYTPSVTPHLHYISTQSSVNLKKLAEQYL